MENDVSRAKLFLLTYSPQVASHVLSPWKLGLSSTWRALNHSPLLQTHGWCCEYGSVQSASPSCCDQSHTVVESSLLFSGYGGALRGSLTFFVFSERLWCGYGGGLRPLRPCTAGGLVEAAGVEHT